MCFPKTGPLTSFNWSSGYFWFPKYVKFNSILHFIEQIWSKMWSAGKIQSFVLLLFLKLFEKYLFRVEQTKGQNADHNLNLIEYGFFSGQRKPLPVCRLRGWFETTTPVSTPWPRSPSCRWFRNAWSTLQGWPQQLTDRERQQTLREAKGHK